VRISSTKKRRSGPIPRVNLKSTHSPLFSVSILMDNLSIITSIFVDSNSIQVATDGIASWINNKNFNTTSSENIPRFFTIFTHVNNISSSTRNQFIRALKILSPLSVYTSVVPKMIKIICGYLLTPVPR